MSKSLEGTLYHMRPDKTRGMTQLWPTGIWVRVALKISRGSEVSVFVVQAGDIMSSLSGASPDSRLRIRCLVILVIKPRVGLGRTKTVRG